ncbi:MAG: ATP-binding protein [Coprobacillus sp.]|nr:ATP-binding protein [Coprobacillus sp.]
MQIIKREEYLKKIRPYYEIDDLIKVISGVRRCGKSTLLGQIKEEIKEKGVRDDHIIEINFEDYGYEKIRSADKMYKYIKSRILDDDKYYIFIDEIQHVRGFEKVINSFRATTNCSIFVTGSNSKLLSGKLGSLLVGRCIEFKINPFSFKEAYNYQLESGNNVSPYDYIEDYLTYGGFPERFKFKGENEVKEYLKQTYEAIINRDIIGEKSKINKQQFLNISSYILKNSGELFSPDSIMRYFERENNKFIERSTIYSYLDKMEEACLINRVKRYDIKGKKLMRYIEKDYVTDLGLKRINTDSLEIGKSYYLESAIYNELINRGYTVYVGKTYKGEIDFVVTSLDKKCYIQVSYLLASEEIIEREYSAFKSIKDACPKFVLSLDRLDFSYNGIKHINIVDFLLGKVDIYLS